LLTPSQASEKELILDQIRMNPRGPWVNGKKISLPKAKGKVIPGAVNAFDSQRKEQGH
jgi:hypothetical protein